MSTLITIIVTFFAGMGAGLGTGFAGLCSLHFWEWTLIWQWE